MDEKMFDKVFLAFLAVLLILLSSAYFAAVTFLNVPEKNLRVVDTVTGFLLGTVIAAVVTTYFSMSRQAQQAQNALANIAAAAPSPPPPAAPQSSAADAPA